MHLDYTTQIEDREWQICSAVKDLRIKMDQIRAHANNIAKSKHSA